MMDMPCFHMWITIGLSSSHKTGFSLAKHNNNNEKCFRSPNSFPFGTFGTGR